MFFYHFVSSIITIRIKHLQQLTYICKLVGISRPSYQYRSVVINT